MTRKRRCLYRSLVCIISLLMLISAFPKALYAQNIFPHQLSEAVQARAKELKIWDQIIKEGFSNRRYIYLDELTAADIMAQSRAEYQGKKVADNSDYDMMFASWCRFIPNKPPLETFSTISNIIRMKLSLSGLYLYNSKRLALKDAMRPVLLKGDIRNLYSILAKIKDIGEFNNKVFDSTFLAK